MFGSDIVCLKQARSQEFALGGLFWRLETISNDLDPNFDRSLIGLSRLFCPNSGDLKKKKGLSPKLRRFSVQSKVISKKRALDRLKQPSFLVKITSGPTPILIANTFGGGIFVFKAKFGFKSAKNGVFCIVFTPMGGNCPPVPLATLLV